MTAFLRRMNRYVLPIKSKPPSTLTDNKKNLFVLAQHVAELSMMTKCHLKWTILRENTERNGAPSQPTTKNSSPQVSQAANPFSNSTLVVPSNFNVLQVTYDLINNDHTTLARLQNAFISPHSLLFAIIHITIT